MTVVLSLAIRTAAATDELGEQLPNDEGEESVSVQLLALFDPKSRSIKVSILKLPPS